MTSVTAVMTLAALAAVVDSTPDVAALARYGTYGLLAWTALLTVPALASKAATRRKASR